MSAMPRLRIRRFATPRIAVSSLAALGVIAAMTNWAAAPARAAVPTVVTIEWHDGNAEQINVVPILDAHGVHATFLVNTGPILAGDSAKLSVSDVQTIHAHGNEIGGHTLDHVNVQPLPFADAAYETCTDTLSATEYPSSIDPVTASVTGPEPRSRGRS